MIDIKNITQKLLNIILGYPIIFTGDLCVRINR